MRRNLCFMLLLAGCATPFSRVKDAVSIDDAKAKLEGYQPKVKHYGPNAEAWYFENDDCVLFVGGQVRMTKAASEHVTYMRDEKNPADAREDRCAPQETKLTPVSQ